MLSIMTFFMDEDGFIFMYEFRAFFFGGSEGGASGITATFAEAGFKGMQRGAPRRAFAFRVAGPG